MGPQKYKNKRHEFIILGDFNINKKAQTDNPGQKGVYIHKMEQGL